MTEECYSRNLNDGVFAIQPPLPAVGKACAPYRLLFIVAH